MPDGKPIVVGFDLSPETTQIAVSRDGEEPESVSVSSTSGQFLIPTVLCVRNDSGDWLFGEEAIRCKNRNAGVFIDDLLGKADASIATLSTRPVPVKSCGPAEWPSSINATQGAVLTRLRG